MDKRLTALLLLLTVVLAACADGEEQRRNPMTDPFIGGNVGVNLFLQNGAPPPQVFDGGKFPFAVNIVVENVGEANIGPGTENPFVQARLEGVNPSTFGVTDGDLVQDLQEPIRGAQKNFDGTIIGGLVANFVFEGLNYQGELQGNEVVTIRGNVCYDYTNLASTQLCFKNDIIENVQDSTLCTLTGEKPIHNSGGPLHIVQVIQNPLAENRIQVNLVLEHVGPGEFYGREQDETCNPSVRNTNKFKVDMEVTMQDSQAVVECYRFGGDNQGRLTLYNGAPQTITCTVEGPNPDTRVYTDTMTIRTEYRYGQFIEQPIVIQALPQDVE